jgi:hypothetical protein
MKNWACLGRKGKEVTPVRPLSITMTDVLLETIQDFYVRQKMVPTCRKLLPVLREKINFQWSEWTLRKVLKEMASDGRNVAPKGEF